MINKLLVWLGLRKPKCSHRFNLDDLCQTKISLPKKPTKDDYFAWKEYFDKIYICEGTTKRVRWPCSDCGEVFFGHCGLDILKKGSMLPWRSRRRG